MEEARRFYEQALQSDSDYVPAIAGLAFVEGQLYRNLDSNPSHLQRAEQYAQRAQTLDPQLPETHLALGTVAADKYDYAGAAREFQTATDLAPSNAYAWNLLSWALGYEQPPDAIAEEKAARESLRLAPSQYVAYYHLGRALIQQKRYTDAIATFERERELDLSTTTYPELGLGQAYLAEGDYDKALANLLKSAQPSAINFYWLSAAYAAKGDKEKALGILQKTFDMGFHDFTALDGSPYFASLRQDPRYQQLVQRYRK